MAPDLQGVLLVQVGVFVHAEKTKHARQAQLVERTGVEVADVDIWEANEAFAAQALSVVKELGLDPEKLVRALRTVAGPGGA